MPTYHNAVPVAEQAIGGRHCRTGSNAGSGEAGHSGARRGRVMRGPPSRLSHGPDCLLWANDLLNLLSCHAKLPAAEYHYGRYEQTLTPPGRGEVADSWASNLPGAVTPPGRLMLVAT